MRLLKSLEIVLPESMEKSGGRGFRVPRGGGTNRTALLLTFICCAGFSLGPALYIRDKYLRPETALTTKSEKAFSPQVAVRGAYTVSSPKFVSRLDRPLLSLC